MSSSLLISIHHFHVVLTSYIGLQIILVYFWSNQGVSAHNSAHFSGDFQPQRENNDVTSGHIFHLTGLLLGKPTHPGYSKSVLQTFRYCLNFVLVCSECWHSVISFFPNKLWKKVN